MAKKRKRRECPVCGGLYTDLRVHQKGECGSVSLVSGEDRGNDDHIDDRLADGFAMLDQDYDGEDE